jgi:hypothetical protein
MFPSFLSNRKKVVNNEDLTPLIDLKTLDYTRYRQLLRGLSLRKPLEEDDWKAVFEKIERTV